MKPDLDILVHIRMVLWSFLGIRRGSAAGDELGKVRPLLLIATALGLAAAFVLTLIGVVGLVTMTAH